MRAVGWAGEGEPESVLTQIQQKQYPQLTLEVFPEILIKVLLTSSSTKLWTILLWIPLDKKMKNRRIFCLAILLGTRQRHPQLSQLEILWKDQGMEWRIRGDLVLER